jgi:hypothetical protein
MATFAHLKQDSPERTAFWEKHKERINNLLIEVNNDVFEGKATFGLFRPQGNHSRNVPVVDDPYLCLNTPKGPLCVFLIGDSDLKVIAENDNSLYMKWWAPTPDYLSIYLEAAIKFLLW